MISSPTSSKDENEDEVGRLNLGLFVNGVLFGLQVLHLLFLVSDPSAAMYSPDCCAFYFAHFAGTTSPARAMTGRAKERSESFEIQLCRSRTRCSSSSLR